MQLVGQTLQNKLIEMKLTRARFSSQPIQPREYGVISLVYVHPCSFSLLPFSLVHVHTQFFLAGPAYLMCAVGNARKTEQRMHTVPFSMYIRSVGAPLPPPLRTLRALVFHSGVFSCTLRASAAAFTIHNTWLFQCIICEFYLGKETVDFSFDYNSRTQRYVDALIVSSSPRGPSPRHLHHLGTPRWLRALLNFFRHLNFRGSSRSFGVVGFLTTRS